MKKTQKNKQKNKDNRESTSLFFGLFVNFLKPSVYSKKIEDINVKALKEQGIKLIMCDLDNTLVPHFTKFPTKAAIKFAEEVEKNGMDFFILSNNSSKRVTFFAEKLKVKKFIANAKKPFPFAMKKAIKESGHDLSEIVMIGDLLITDILAANIIGVDSILVSPLIDSDIVLNKIIQWLEKKVFERLSTNKLLLEEGELIKEKLTEDYDIL